MSKTYITQIDHGQDYPFKNLPSHFSSQEVQISFPFQSFEGKVENFHKAVCDVLEVQRRNPSIIKLLKVQQLRNKHSFLLTYEHIPHNITELKNRNFSLKRIYNEMILLGQILKERNMPFELETRLFGFTNSKQLKYLLLPKLRLLSTEDLTKRANQSEQLHLRVRQFLMRVLNADSIKSEDQVSCEKSSERNLTKYNQQFEEKISFLESRLLLSRYCPEKAMNSSLKLFKQKKMSQNSIETSRSDSSESTSSVDRKNKVHSIFSKSYQSQVAQEILNPDEQSPFKQAVFKNLKFLKANPKKTSGSDSSESQSKQLASSQDAHQKGKLEKLKQHKSSFGDYEVRVDSEKQFELKKRISFAFEKSQNALKVYEKYQRKKSGSSLGKKNTKNSTENSIKGRRVSFKETGNERIYLQSAHLKGDQNNIQTLQK